MSEETVEKPRDEKVTLKDFVDDHQKMIAVIGVFVALGLLWKLIGKESPIPFLTYLCFFITIPLFLEIVINWYRINGTWRLRVFIELFVGILMLSLGHLVSDYPHHFDVLLTYAIPLAVFLGIFHLLDSAKNIITFIWKDIIHVRAKRRGLKIEEIAELINQKETVFKFWGGIIDIVSIILMAGIFFSWVIFSEQIRQILLPTVEVIFERPIDKQVKPPE
jgi:hypothetical protein